MAPIGLFEDGSRVIFSTDIRVETDIELEEGVSLISSQEGASLSVYSDDVVATRNLEDRATGQAITLLPSENGDIYVNGAPHPDGVVLMGWKLKPEQRG